MSALTRLLLRLSFMETQNVELASLRIDRSSQGFGPSRRSRWLRRIILWTVIIAVLIAGFLFLKDYLNPGIEVQLATASLTSPAQANAVLTASGYVVARRKAAVASKGTGTLMFLGVEEGDRVKKGQVIARLEDSDVAATLQRARENLRVAEADLKDAKQSLERERILLNEGVVAQAEFDAAEARYNRVVASIDAAKFAVKEAEVAVENTRIVAPFDGTVLKKKRRRRRNRCALGRRSELPRGGRDDSRHVIARSRRRRVGSQYHSSLAEPELRSQTRCLSRARVSSLRQQDRADRGSRQGHGSGEN